MPDTHARVRLLHVSYLTSVRSTLLPRILQPGVKLCR